MYAKVKSLECVVGLNCRSALFISRSVQCTSQQGDLFVAPVCSPRIIHKAADLKETGK
jgi:hypothetical protein